MPLSDQIKIARRFLRSVRIDTDLSSPQALIGFTCPQSSAELLLTMGQHISETRQGAFTWTGPYGSGKSSLAAAFSALLNGDAGVQKQVVKVFGQQLTKSMHKALPMGSQGWRVLPVVGRRSSPVEAIGDAIKEFGLASRPPAEGWNERNLIAALTKAASEKPRTYGGLVLFIDEMGKFLEDAAQGNSDVFILQELAEAASRSGGRLVVVGILHQAFEEYAHRLSGETHKEWAKIQGRFVDLVVDTAAEEQIDLIARSIESKGQHPSIQKPAEKIARTVLKGRPDEAKQLASTLQDCWPLHPATACLLGPISRRRFGQNQRSIFGFLNSSEPHGFQDFLTISGKQDLYRPDRLWDYLRVNLEPSILASPDGHRWALATEALERCERLGGDEAHLKLLKTIAIIDMFKERSGLSPNLEILKLCVPEVSAKQLSAALKDLKTWSVIIFKKFLDAYAIFAGSDFDIEGALRTALNETEEDDFSGLNAIAGFQPILAKRHYHETGAMRWFDVNIMPVSHLEEHAAGYRPENGAIGQFLLAIPTKGETSEQIEKICRQAARESDAPGINRDIVVGISERAWAVPPLARELLALDKVLKDHPELQGDDVARREVSARIVEVQTNLELEIQGVFNTAKWFRKGHQRKALLQAALDHEASELADRRYPKSPKLHNELLNRQHPSSNAVAAQNELLRLMVQNEGSERLGIEGTPAHGGLFVSMLEATGLYRETPDGWRFVSPDAETDPARFGPLWKAAIEHIQDQSGQPIAMEALYQLWQDQPYGVKSGLLPVLAVAFLLSQRETLAIYREGVFRPQMEEIDVDYLILNPKSVQLRWMALDDASRRLLLAMADTVQTLTPEYDLRHAQPIDVARGLVSIYESLPTWTKRTTRLSGNGLKIRDLFKHANDPNRLIFDDLPAQLGQGKKIKSSANLEQVVARAREGLEELVQAYPSMLELQQTLMLNELEVPNNSPQSLAELRDRAEKVRQKAADLRVEAFIGRLGQLDGNLQGFESIVSLATNKPPAQWVDLDLNKARLEISQFVREFLKLESIERFKSQPSKRVAAMAEVLGLDGQPRSPDDMVDPERKAVEALLKPLKKKLRSGDQSHRDYILKVFAEFVVDHFTRQEPGEKPKKATSKTRARARKSKE